MSSRWLIGVLLILALPALAAVPLPNAALLNLCTLRGVKTSASANCNTPSDWPLHPVHTAEMRFQSNYGAAWWMCELPKVYKISRHRIGYRDPMVSMGYRIKVSTVPLNEAGWAAQPFIFEFKGPLETGNQDGLCRRWSSGDFKPVAAKFIRIEWFGHNGAETGGVGKDHADLIVGKIQFYGPNAVDATAQVSLAQSSWAGGQAVLRQQYGGGNVPGVIDDSESKAAGFNNLTNTFVTNAGNADPAKLPFKPAEYVVTLEHRAQVDLVAYAAISPNRADRPRDMNIYTSPYAIGEEWTLQKELRDIPGGTYEEIKFDKPVLAKRVKFQIPRVWQDRPDPARSIASGYMAELYVYGAALPPNVTFTLPQGGLSSGVIVDDAGNIIRSLWTLQTFAAGKHQTEWDGLTDTFVQVPPGEYTLRIILNSGAYKNVAAIGNDGSPPNADGHVPMGIASVAIDDQGAVYSANGWDEAGHDWKKWDKDGRAVMHANFQIRNGNPNGLPYRITVDDRYIYTVYTSHNGDGKVGSQYIQRFDRNTGKSVKFYKGYEKNGLIQVYPPPEKDEWRNPITELVVVKNRLYAGDSLANRVLIYDRESGEKLGEFAVEKPGAMAADGKGQLWIARDGTVVDVYDGDGKRLGEVLRGLGAIKGLALAPDGTLYLADGKAGQVITYTVDGLKATRKKAFGQPAKPGDAQPDHFYALSALAVGPDGLPVTVDHFPLGGSRIIKWTAALAPGWQHLGLEFTGNAAYAKETPDTIVSNYMNRYTLDKKTGAWKFAGNLYTGGVTNQQWHGTPRWATLGGNRFFFYAIGDGLYVFRLVGDELRHVASVGGKYPNEKGVDAEGGPLGQWTWTDANGNNKTDDDEITWYKKPGEGQYYVFGMNIDTRGNIIYCDHHTRSAWMIPMKGLNKAGNPTYDWAEKKEVIPADTSKVKFMPLMAVRTDADTFYAFGRSELYPPDPASGPAWMSGWVLAKFDATGKRLWVARLPNHVTGMDYIPPDKGVMAGYFAEAVVYHYTADGLLVGSMRPGEAAGGISGWLDNTASVAVNRDPRDGLLDVFVEEDFAHRILWYRADDTKIRVLNQKIVKD